MKNQPYFAPRGPASPGEIVVNAAAPIIEIKLIMDCRFNPPKLQMMAPENMPASVIMKAFNDAMGVLLGMQITAEINSGKAQDRPPDLPPAPNKS